MRVSDEVIRLDDIDREILRSLYKVDFMMEYHVAALVGEPVPFIRGRLKKLARAGLIKRKVIVGNMPCVNWLTKKGIKELGEELRNVREPTTGRFDHSLGCVDTYVYLTLLRRRSDGSYRRAVTFGEIITERDFNAARELKEIKRKSNGQPVYIALDRNIHAPDGYYAKNNRLIAIEYERTPKSKAKILRDNVYANRKRFHAQVWVYDKETVHKMLTELKQELGNEIIIISIEAIREEIKRYVDALPAVISSKSGVPRISAVGQLVKTTPLNRLPIIGGHSAVPVLETRPGNGPDLDVRRPTSDPNPSQPIKRPEHGPAPGHDTSTLRPGPNMARTETNRRPQQGSTLTKKVILERRGS